MKENINLSCFLLLSLFLATFNSLKTKIDLFDFKKVQDFKELNNEDKIYKNENIFRKKIITVKNRKKYQKIKISKVKNEKETSQLNELLNLLISKYDKLKSQVIKNSKKNVRLEKQRKSIFNTIRFKQNEEESDKYGKSYKNHKQDNPSSEINEENSPHNKQDSSNNNHKESLFSGGDKKEIIPFFPLHMLTKAPRLMPNSHKKDVYISKGLLKKLKFNRQWGLKTAIRSVPIQECSVYWDYGLHGDNWSCLCEIGKSQSPINIKKTETKPTKSNVFFDLKTPKMCGKDKENSTCKFPLIKNTGLGLNLEYNCGYLVLPENGFGYKCEKILFHTPSEHKIDGKHFDLELQILFKSDPSKKGKINNTNAVVVVLFEGIDDSWLNSDKKYSNFRNNFLESLELDKLPQHKGEARLLDSVPDFEELFNILKQPDEKDMNRLISKKNNKGEFTVKELETFKKANHNKDKINQNPNESSNLKERQKLHYKKYLRQFQEKILSRIKAKLRKRKFNLKGKNHNTNNDYDENPFDDNENISKGNNTEISDDEENDDYNEENNLNPYIHKNLKKSKRKIKNLKKDNRHYKIKKISDYSGLFNRSNRSEEEPWNGHKHNDTDISEDLDNIIERNINYKINQDNDLLEKNNENSLFSTSFLKIDDKISYSNKEIFPEFDDKKETFYSKRNNDTKISYYNYNPKYPLSEFFTYSGSETTPPCEEKHTYIVYGKPVYARLSQIIKISSLISSAIFKLGNNRNIQNINKRTVYHYNQKVICKSKRMSSVYPNMLEKGSNDDVKDEILEKAFKLNLNDFGAYIKQKIIES